MSDRADAPLGLKAAMHGVRAAAPRQLAFSVGLACGFTPLHLQSFVAAYVAQRNVDARPDVITGTYGDLSVALADLAVERTDACMVFLDWADLDPRLSPRRAGAPPVDPGDLARTTGQRLTRLVPLLAQLARSQPVVLVPPTLAFPAYGSTRTGQLSGLEASVRALLAGFLSEVSGIERVRVLAALAAGPDAQDLRMQLKADFPFTVPYASALARDGVDLLMAPPEKKGLITDLDDTLWRGLVGEVGPSAVTWDLDSGSQPHAMYQQLLRRLSAGGALIGIASKNEPSIVEQALARRDLVLDIDKVFPVKASWRPKSQAVAEILEAWNIGASDVVFVDDNPLELAEIARAYPDITVVQFRPHDPAGTLAMIRDLDSLFARDTRSAEDELRVASLRSAAQFAESQDDGPDYLAFLTDVDARIELNFAGEQPQRAYELVQKTNQFNLNGRRHTLAEWQALAERHGAVAVSVKYTDRFGELGVISVLTGILDGSTLSLDSWVLSCRAFSRAVELHTLAAVADHLGVTEVVLDYVETSRNKPVQAFLTGVGADVTAVRPVIDVTAVLADPASRLHAIAVTEPHPGLTTRQGVPVQ